MISTSLLNIALKSKAPIFLPLQEPANKRAPTLQIKGFSAFRSYPLGKNSKQRIPSPSVNRLGGSGNPILSLGLLDLRGGIRRMGSGASEDGGGESRQTQVLLNVYDLTPANHYTYWFGFGIFHSGIEVHGMEYAFGAHDFPVSGVFEVEPRSCPGFIYRCSIPLGRINMLQSEFRTFIENVAAEYHGDTYHLISKNCNHFTNDVARRLTGKPIPGWVNRLARVGSLCNCLLPECLQVTTVKQLPEYHECLEDGSESSSADSPHEHTESDEADGYKLLPASQSVNLDVAFIKEVER